MNILMLMMGGCGNRFGSKIPKQYIIVNEKPLFLNIIEKYSLIPNIDKIIIVSNKNWIIQTKEWCKKSSIPCLITEGGNTRSLSIYNGLCVAKSFASYNDIILIHDATHPYIDIKMVPNIIEEAKKYGAATLVSKIYDTIYKINDLNYIDKVEARERIVVGASPEAFQFGVIYKIFKKTKKEDLEQLTSAGAIALYNKIKIKFLITDILNLKITYEQDMHLFKILMQQNYF